MWFTAEDGWDPADFWANCFETLDFCSPKKIRKGSQLGAAWFRSYSIMKLQSGLQDTLLQCGFIATIRAVEKRNVEVVLPCGESRRIWYQIEMPSSRANELLQRWRKCLIKSQRQSAWG